MMVPHRPVCLLASFFHPSLPPNQKDEAVPLAAGDELLISYEGGYSPLEAWLKFGFVADEWWP